MRLEPIPHTAGGVNSAHIGRLIFNCPTVPMVRFSKAEIADVELSSEVLGTQTMAQWLAARTATIRAGKLSMDRPSPLLRSYRLPDGVPANLFWSLPASEVQRLEAYKQIGQDVLILGTDGFAKELPISERLAVAIAASFQPVARGSGATPGGFGVEDGVVQRPFENNEIAEATVQMGDGQSKEPLDLKLTVVTHVYADAGKSTLPARVRRGQEAELIIRATSPRMKIDTLRNGGRTVSGVAGQEFFQFTDNGEKEPKTGVHAEFEYGGDANDPLRPYLQIIMDADELPPGLKAPDLLRVWDNVLQSAELRK